MDAGAGVRADRPAAWDSCRGEDRGAVSALVGFSPQKPARRAFEQNPEIVKRWLDERYPAIKEHAHREKSLILWADEMG